MSGLILNLRPYEKFIINGTVIQNGQRRSQIRVLDSDTGVLRMSDALHPDDAKTPLSTAYMVAQSIIVGDVKVRDAHSTLLQLLGDICVAFSGVTFAEEVELAIRHAQKKSYYKVLKTIRPLLAKEAALLLALPKP